MQIKVSHNRETAEDTSRDTVIISNDNYASPHWVDLIFNKREKNGEDEELFSTSMTVEDLFRAVKPFYEQSIKDREI